jgi:cytochrome c oxidase assembly protein subunit 15
VHVASSRIGRIRAAELSPTRFLAVAGAQLGALWLIVATGAAVRLTDSGLGCRHWPGCEKGHPLPEKDYHAYIEFGNRLVGGVVIALTLIAWLSARRTRGLPVWARRLALGVFLGTLAQAPLGYLAVKSDLRWPVVMAHLLLSMLLLAGAVVLFVETLGVVQGRAAPLVTAEVRGVALTFSVACLLLLVSGGFATAAGPHSGGGAHIDRFGKLNTAVYVHAAVVGLFGCLFLFAVGYLAARRSSAPRLFRLAVGLLALLLVQMGFGELQWRTHLPWGLVLVHVALAAAVWGGAIAVAALLFRPPVSFAGSRA